MATFDIVVIGAGVYVCFPNVSPLILPDIVSKYSRPFPIASHLLFRMQV